MLALVTGAAARNEDHWALTSKIEQLHRSHRALHTLVQRGAQQTARVVAIAPQLRDAAPKTAKPHARQVGPDDPWWPLSALPEHPLQPPPGLETYALGAVRSDALAVSVLGLRGADLDHAVARIADEQRNDRAFKPVFLTDSPDFGPMAQRGFAVEYVPTDEQATAGDHLGMPPKRYAFLARKWGFARAVDLREARAPVLPSQPPGPVRQALTPAAPKTEKRRKAAVISWDLGHNPVGRAMVLYDLLDRDWDVELVGPLWSRFGGKVWGPIADSDRRVRGFACDTLEAVLASRPRPGGIGRL